MANILVVEDEAPLRQTLVEYLVSEGHSPTGAGNGEEALQLYASSQPDLIISDIRMPIMDGYQFLETLRLKYPEAEDIPFFFMSALSNADDQIKGLSLGVDEYLCKPIDFGVLNTRIELSLMRQEKIKKKICDALTEHVARIKENAGPIVKTGPSFKNTASSEGGLLGSKRLNLSRQQQRNIKSINSPQNLLYTNILSCNAKKASISRLAFKKDKYDSLIDDITSAEFDEKFFLSVNELFYTSAIYYLDRTNLSRERSIIFPFIYEYAINKKIREKFLIILDHIQGKYSVPIVTEIVNYLDSYLALEDVLEALSFRKSLQIIEITRLEQLKGIDFESLRIGAVSMNYADAMKISEGEISRLRKLLTNSNANFYIKEIPEGSLGQAQMAKADLLSMSGR